MMKTNWRELRDTLEREGAFSTFNTFNHRGDGEGHEENAASEPMVNSAEMVKRPKERTPQSGNPMAKSVNSAESPCAWSAADSWEWMEERAALLEYDGGLPRDLANLRAFEMWYAVFIEPQPKSE